MSFKATLRKAWVDPVWSKVISGGILAALGALGTVLYQVGQWLMTINWGDTVQPVIEEIAWLLNIAVPLWIVLFLLVAILLARYLFKWLGRWARRGTVSTSSTNTLSTQSTKGYVQGTDQVVSGGVGEGCSTAEELGATAQAQSHLEYIEAGVTKDSSGQYRIALAPTVFFSYRMAFTFPGLNGLRIIDNTSDALYRLNRLLHHPIRFDEAMGHGHSTNPIWWTRGPSNLAIERFEATANGIAMMDEQELKVKRIAAYSSSAYYHAFIYVEVEGMPPSGAYPHSPESMNYWMENHGYALEEYGYLDGRVFELKFHDDGYLESDGQIENVSGSVRRRRYLTAYNFIILPRTSPLLDRERDDDVKKMLDDILHGRSNVDVLEDYVSPLPKSRRDD